MRKRLGSVVCCFALFTGTASALNIVPNKVGDPHFTSGPCPMMTPLDGATCPNGASQCPAFYNPALLPAGYNSVSYCADVPAGIGFNSPGYGYRTMPLNAQEQEAFLKAAQKVESYVKDNQTVTMEVYKVQYIWSASGQNYEFFGGNEYWNPVCAADALLPPFSNQAPTIVENPDGSSSYANMPETYTVVLNALKAKNARNQSPMQLINYLPSQSQINVEWPPSFFAWQQSTGLAAYRVSNFLTGTSSNYPVTPGTKPFTLCAAPAAMKMLGFAPAFNKNGHTIDDFNSPQYNMNVTLTGTDGALVIPDLTTLPPPYTPPSTWIYDSTAPSVTATQLPKAYIENSLNLWLPQVSCSDPTQCIFPQGVSGGQDLVSVFNHEINHMLGLMQSQYYKVSGEETALSYTYGNALFLLDLFDVDSDYVVPGYGSAGIQSPKDFTLVPRNNDTYEPTTIYFAASAGDLTPFVQYGLHDHVMVYAVNNGEPQYFPMMNDTVGNPDGDIQFQQGWVYNPTYTSESVVLVDPLLTALPPMDVVHFNVQAGGINGTVDVDTIREYSELAAEGWDINYSTLQDPYHTVSPLAKWYQTCFDGNGVFTTAKNANCEFSVTPQDLKFLH